MSALKKVSLFNSLSKKVQEFVPMVAGKASIYTCGPTVYSYPHIGNMRSFMFADGLKRVLEYFKYDVNHVMNITDVGHLVGDGDQGEDKMEVGMRKEGLDAWGVAKKFTDIYFDHAELINIKKPGTVCLATDHIDEQIDMVQKLMDKGFGYITDDGIYFDTSKFENYGKMARLDIEGLREGIRVEMSQKRNKTDFAIWKFSPKGEKKRDMEWQSPWGVGFPGWHIECSAMASKYLGDSFDIHTGGVDHIPIHHTNEIAQSECATGCSPFVNYWMHGEFLIMEDGTEKMSKSLGNIITVGSLEEDGVDPLSFRYLCLNTHYRKQLKFSTESLLGAGKAYSRLCEQISEVKKSVDLGNLSELSSSANKYLDALEVAAANDLNMPQIVANLWMLLDDKELSASDKWQLAVMHDLVTGLKTTEERQKKELSIPAEITALLTDRQNARASKDWAAADKARDAIAAAGYEILDSPKGPMLNKLLK
jgi:cysteinyl-tRNA synthetase